MELRFGLLLLFLFCLYLFMLESLIPTDVGNIVTVLSAFWLGLLDFYEVGLRVNLYFGVLRWVLVMIYLDLVTLLISLIASWFKDNLEEVFPERRSANILRKWLGSGGYISRAYY